MLPSDSANPEIEQFAKRESQRQMLLYVDKQMLANKRYRELVQGFRRRALGTVYLMGFLLMMQILQESLHIATLDEPWAPNWGRLLMATLLAVAFAMALRDVRRCTRALQSAEASSGAAQGGST